MREISPEELRKILKEHKRRFKTDKKEGEKADLSFANLSDADLRETNLGGAILLCADLRNANLRKAYLWKANLRKANLSKADLSDADMICANLSEVDLSGASLTQVKNLFINQLSEVKSLYKAELDHELMEQVKGKYPHLLEKPEEE